MVEYKFEVRQVRDNDRQIELVYLLNDGQTRHVLTKLPKDGESIYDLVTKYAPVAFWDVPELQPVWSPAPSGALPQVADAIPVTEL